MRSSTPDLLLYNANVITMDAALPRASWVAVSDGLITSVGLGKPPREWTGSATRAIDCQGGTLVPGFNDAHCHVLATAASLLAVDCSPSVVSSIQDIAEQLRTRAAGAPPDAWIRATGYNEFYLRENSHPTRWDLDAAVPDRPVRLTHRSGHAVVLNSRALALAGIHRDTPDPVYGVIDRDTDTGEPTGLLLEMDDYLEGVVPPLSQEEVYAGVRLFNEQCLSLGITSLQDATPGNSPERWRLFEGIKGAGPSHTKPDAHGRRGSPDPLPGRGLCIRPHGAGHAAGRRQVMLTMTTGALNPSREELHRIVWEAQRSGFQVAIHAVEMEAVEAAVEAIRQQTQGPSAARRHRIEHCSECTPHPC